jgi:hypothetical protein
LMDKSSHVYDMKLYPLKAHSGTQNMKYSFGDIR